MMQKPLSNYFTPLSKIMRLLLVISILLNIANLILATLIMSEQLFLNRRAMGGYILISGLGVMSGVFCAGWLYGHQSRIEDLTNKES